MVLNPFLEGVILLVLGVALVVVAHAYTMVELADTGKVVVGTGLGYLGKTGVEAQKRGGNGA